MQLAAQRRSGDAQDRACTIDSAVYRCDNAIAYQVRLQLLRVKKIEPRADAGGRIQVASLGSVDYRGARAQKFARSAASRRRTTWCDFIARTCPTNSRPVDPVRATKSILAAIASYRYVSGRRGLQGLLVCIVPLAYDRNSYLALYRG